MRAPMERLDALVAGLGVLVVAVALGGVVTAPPAGGAGTFTIGFVADRATLPPAQANLNGDGTATVPVQVGARNLTRLEFAIQVTLTGAPPTTTVAIAADGPARQHAEGPATVNAGVPTATASGTLALDLGPLPAPVTVQAGTTEGALAAANRGTNNGTGAWTISVTVQSGLPASPASAAISVTPTTVGYHAVVQPDVANPR
jgi:hypothetical protein